MPVIVLELPSLIHEGALDDLSTSQLRTALDMVRAANDIWHLPKQPEKYNDYSLTINSNEIAFWTLRVNDTHRLIYVIFEGCFFPLEFIANHNIRNAKLFNPANHETRTTITSAIVARYTEHLQSLPTSGAAAVASSTNSPVKRNQVVLTAKQAEINNQLGGKIVIAPAGAGKTVIAAHTLETMARTLPQVMYIAPSNRLARDVEKEFPEELRVNTRFLSWDALRTLLIAKFPELNTMEKIEADFNYFQTWYKTKNNFDFKSKKEKQEIAHRAALLYAEFTQIIIQPSSDASLPYLTKENYLALGENAAYLPREMRAETYDLFCNYLRELRNDHYFEPHIHAFYFAQQLQQLKTQEPDHALFIDGIAADEMQRLHIYIMKCLFLLLKKPQAGNFFLCGDPHQLSGAQRRRVLEPVTQLLNSENIPFTVYQVDENHRNAQSVVTLSNMFLRAEQVWWGSAERTGVFLLKAQATAIAGSVDSKNYDLTFANQVKQSANWVVLIPDTADLDVARTRFGDNVMHASTAGGLEWDHVIFDGLEIQEPCRELAQFARENMPSSEGEIVYAQGRGRVTPSLTARDMMHGFYTATTRARQSIIFIDTPLASEFIAKTAITSAQSAPPQPITASTPQEWLAVVKRYIEQEAFDTAQPILWGANIWGTVEAGKAAQTRYAARPFDLALCDIIANELNGVTTQNQNNQISLLFDKKNWNNDQTLADAAKKLFNPFLMSRKNGDTVVETKIKEAANLSSIPLFKRYIFFMNKLRETPSPLTIEQIITERDALIEFALKILAEGDDSTLIFLCEFHTHNNPFKDLKILEDQPGYHHILNAAIRCNKTNRTRSFLHLLILCADNNWNFGVKYIQWIIDLNNNDLFKGLADDITQPREITKNTSLLNYLASHLLSLEDTPRVFEKVLLLIEKSTEMRNALLRHGNDNLIFIAALIKNFSLCRRLCALPSFIPMIAEAFIKDEIFEDVSRNKLCLFIKNNNGLEIINHVLTTNTVFLPQFIFYALKSFTDFPAKSHYGNDEEGKIFTLFLGCCANDEQMRTKFKNDPDFFKPFMRANSSTYTQPLLRALENPVITTIKHILGTTGRKHKFDKSTDPSFVSNLLIDGIDKQLESVRATLISISSTFAAQGLWGSTQKASESKTNTYLKEIEDIICLQAQSPKYNAIQAIISLIQDRFSEWPSPVKKLFTNIYFFTEVNNRPVFHEVVTRIARMGTQSTSARAARA